MRSSRRRSHRVASPIPVLLVAVLACGGAWSVHALDEAEKDAKSEPGEKKEEPKIPPFRCSAWCAFRDFTWVQRAEQQKAPTAEELQKSEHTRPRSVHWGGFARRGAWVALVVELENTTEEETIAGEIRVQLDPSRESTETGQRSYTTRYRQPYELAPKTIQPFSFSVLCPEFEPDPIEIRVTANGVGFQRMVSLLDLDRFRDSLIVVVSEHPGAFKYLLRPPRTDAGAGEDGASARQVAVVPPEDLPRRWHDLTLADLIILDGLPRDGLSDAQLAALRGYCQAGGRLLISSGQDPARLKPAAGAGHSLADLAGLRVRELATLKSLDLEPPFRPAGADWELTAIDVTPTSEGGAAAVFRNRETGLVEKLVRQVGLGSVTFLSFSLRDEKLLGWAGRLQLPLRLLAGAPRRGLWAHENAPGETAGGGIPGVLQEEPRPKATTLTALRESLDNSFANDTPVETPKATIVASFLLLYLLAAVPLNYFIFGWFKRREVAWLAAPLWALAFSLTAYAVGYMGQQGRLTVNQVCVLQAGTGQREGVCRTFLGVYAPRRGDYQMEFEAGKEGGDSPQAAPGHLVSPALRTRGITDTLPEMDVLERADGSLSIERLLVYSRSTRRLEVTHLAPLGGGIAAQLVFRDGRPGEVRVRNDAEFELLNVAVVYASSGAWRGVRLPDLPPRMSEPHVATPAPTDVLDMDEAFFGRKIVFRSARGPDAADRARSVVTYLRQHLAAYAGSVLLAWADGGRLPTQITRQGQPWAHVERGLTLLVLPLPEAGEAGRHNWAAYYSHDLTSDPQLAAWRALATGQAPIAKLGDLGGHCLLKFLPPAAVLLLAGRTFNLKFTLRALTAKEVPRLGARTVAGFRGRLTAEVARWSSDGRLVGWKKLSDLGVPQAPAGELSYDLGGSLTEEALGPQNSLVIKFSSSDLLMLAPWDLSEWPLALKNIEIKAAGRQAPK